MDAFDVATRRARRTARGLVLNGAPAVIVADAMITQAAAVWAAETGKEEYAAELLSIWAAIRDAK